MAVPGRSRAPGTKVMETLQADAFRDGRLLREGTWVVAFLADWCPFSQRFRPKFAALDGGSAFRTAVGDVTAEESALWDDFLIEAIPTLIVFREGRPIFRADGLLGLGLPEESLGAARSAALSNRTGGRPAETSGSREWRDALE